MSSFEISNSLRQGGIEDISEVKKKQLSLRTVNQKNNFKLSEVDFSEKFTDSPEKLAKALKTIDSISTNLNEINTFIEEAKHGIYTNNQRLEKEEEFLKIIKDVKELKNTDEFKSIQNQLHKSGINLNIGSQKVDNFLNHFFDTGLDESQPDLTGIYDQISSLNRLNANNFTVVGEHLVTELSSIDEQSTGILEGIAIFSSENSNVENSMNIEAVSESFKTFSSRTYSSDNNKVLVSLDGLKTEGNLETDFKAAYLFDTESQTQISSFSHPDFEVNMTFKGGEIKDDHVHIHSDGAEYVFKADGEFINKFKTENGQKLNESRIVHNDLYAIGPASEKVDGEIVGALYKFDIESGKQITEIPKPGSSGNGTFGVNMESLDDKLFIAESDIIKKDGAHFTKGRIHVFNTTTGSFEGEINPKNDVKGAGLFGESMAVSNTFLAVTAKSSSVTGTENTSIHVFDSRLGTQIHKITPQYYGTELAGNIEISDDKLLISSNDKAGRSNIYEFDLSSREKNLNKFISMIGDDTRVIDAIKTNIVANRLSDMNKATTYEGREANTYEGRELTAHTNLEDANPKDISNPKNNSGKNFFKKREGSILEKHDTPLDQLTKNIDFKDREITNEKVEKLENRKLSQDHKEVKHDSSHAQIRENIHFETKIETGISNTYKSKETERKDNTDNNQKLNGQIDDEKNIINNFVSNIEFQASIAANQTSHKIKTSIRINESKTFKAQANISPAAALDMLP